MAASVSRLMKEYEFRKSSLSEILLADDLLTLRDFRVRAAIFDHTILGEFQILKISTMSGSCSN